MAEKRYLLRTCLDESKFWEIGEEERLSNVTRFYYKFSHEERYVKITGLWITLRSTHATENMVKKCVFGQAVNCLPDEILQIDKLFGLNAAISDRIP